MALALLGSTTRSVPDFIQTELRTSLAIGFADRSANAMHPSQVAASPTTLLNEGNSLISSGEFALVSLISYQQLPQLRP